MKLIDKAAVVAEIEKRKKKNLLNEGAYEEDIDIIGLVNTLEVKDPYEQCVQYDSIKAGIQAHAETYSFNIESELFNQLTKEQQALWKKEIEQAVVNGGEVGCELARDMRYQKNVEVKEVDLEEEIENYLSTYWPKEKELYPFLGHVAKYFFELGLKAQKGE